MKRFLHNRDVFGEPIHVAYKGHETYRTTPGSLLTLLMQVMTVIYLAIKVSEVIHLSDPQIVNYKQPLTKEDKRDVIPIELGDKGYVVAV